jgi:hypothetical protein
MAETAAPQEFYDAIAAAVNAHGLNMMDSCIALSDIICGLARAAGLSQEQFQQMMEIIWKETQVNPQQVVATG